MNNLRIAALFSLGSSALISPLLAQAPPAPPEPPAPPTPPEPPSPSFESGGTTRTEKRLEKLAFGSKLWVKNRNGAIKVVGWDREEVSLTAQIRDTGARKVELVLQHKGADLDIEAVFQQPSFSFGFTFARSPFCEMTLQVPSKLLGHFRTMNGRVEVANVEGYVRVETSNGRIELSDLKGEVFAETSNGRIEARKINARIKGNTSNGRIILENVEGGIQMDTSNGSITARNLDGWGEGITLETSNGSIEVELGKATGELKVGNTHGGLDLQIPNAQVLEMGKHTARLKIPGKQQLIKLETTNGSIKVR